MQLATDFAVGEVQSNDFPHLIQPVVKRAAMHVELLGGALGIATAVEVRLKCLREVEA